MKIYKIFIALISMFFIGCVSYPDLKEPTPLEREQSVDRIIAIQKQRAQDVLDWKPITSLAVETNNSTRIK
jgi:hypothetical protein